MSDLLSNYQKIKNAIPSSVELLPVSKGQDLKKLKAWLDAGLPKNFAENYFSELEEKNEALSKEKIQWNFLGPLQVKKFQRL